MRQLTAEERERLTKLREGFGWLMGEVPRFIRELAEVVGMEREVSAPPALVVRKVDEVLASPEFEGLDEEERKLLGVRIAFFAGDCLVQLHSGRWAIQEDPDATAFGMVVVEDCLTPSSCVGVDRFVDIGQLGINAILSRNLREELLKLPLKGGPTWLQPAGGSTR